MDIFACFETFGAFVPATLVVTQFINEKFSITKNIWKQIVSWTVPVIMAILGLVFQLGIFVDYGTVHSINAWIMTLITGIGAGLASNGVYDISIVKQTLQYITQYIKTKFAK